MCHVCTEREIEKEKEIEVEIEHLFELKPSRYGEYVYKTITYSNKQK